MGQPEDCRRHTGQYSLARPEEAILSHFISLPRLPLPFVCATPHEEPPECLQTSAFQSLSHRPTGNSNLPRAGTLRTPGLCVPHLRRERAELSCTRGELSSSHSIFPSLHSPRTRRLSDDRLRPYFRRCSPSLSGRPALPRLAGLPSPYPEPATRLLLLLNATCLLQAAARPRAPQPNRRTPRRRRTTAPCSVCATCARR